MKKILLIFAVFIVGFSIYSFVIKDKYPSNISEEMIKVYKSDHLKTIKNEELNSYLQKNFVRFFDKVDFVDAQHSENGEYYYLVFGIKNGKETTEALKIEKSDIENETYSYINFANVEQSELAEFCYSNLECPCYHRTSDRQCGTYICGLWDGFNCGP